MKREVLLIEDDANYRKSIKSMFRGEPFEFIEAASPEKGIEILGAKPNIKVILLDLSFRNGFGTAVLDYIKPRSDEYRVIVLTAHEKLLRAERAGEYAVFNYLPKTQESEKEAIRFSVEQAFKDLERQQLARKVGLLVEVQKAISAGKATKETLDLICHSIRSTVGGYTCHIRVYNSSRGDYDLAGFAGPGQEIRRIFERPRLKGELFSGRVVESGEAEVFPDLQAMEEFRTFAKKALSAEGVSPAEQSYWESVRSAYIVPISTGLVETVIDAVLNVSSDSLAYFTPENQITVNDFVSLATITITKDWLHKKREEIHKDHSHISRMLSDMTGELKGADALKGIYEVVTQRISELVNPEVVSIFLFNESTLKLENVAELRGGQSMDGSEEAYESGQSLTGSVFKSERPIQLPTPGGKGLDTPLKDDRFDNAKKEEYLRNIPSGRLEHYVGVPIRIGGRVRGVLKAVNKKSEYYGETLDKRDRLCLLERGFSADCRNILEITASHLAVAIRNAELLKEKDAQVEQVRSLGAVGRLISSALDIDQVLKRTIEEMADVMQAEICMLFLREGENRIVLKQCFGIPSSMLEGAFYEIGDGVTGAVARTGEPELITKTHKHDGKYDAQIHAFLTEKHGEETEIDSLMVVPILAKGSILGAMKVINKVGDHLEYSPSDLAFFKTFADYVGVAIENANAVAERNAALSQLVRAVAHEINNTSGLIAANLAGIRAQFQGSNERIIRMLDRIEDVASQAIEFVNEIAGFSGKGERQALNINEVIEYAIETLRDDPKYKNSETNKIRVELSLYDRPLICELYKGPFAQITRNIVINAFQALESTDHGEIWVSTSHGEGKSGSVATIQVRDNGPGILLENQKKIFDANFTTKVKGNGVGLWLVRKHLEEIGGEITVQSTPGEGALFIVIIPLCGT